MIFYTPILNQFNNTAKNKKDDEDMYCIVGAVRAKYSLSLIPDKLSIMWFIGLKNAMNTLDVKIYQCIRSTGLLSKRFKTDK